LSTSFYLFDLYDFVVMHDRGELVLRMLQHWGSPGSPGVAVLRGAAVMIGRGVSLISLPVALLLMVGCGWESWVLGHPELGERIFDRWLGTFRD